MNLGNWSSFSRGDICDPLLKLGDSFLCNRARNFSSQFIDRHSGFQILFPSSVVVPQHGQKLLKLHYVGGNVALSVKDSGCKRHQLTSFANFNPPKCLIDLSGEYESDDEEFRFFRNRAGQFFDTTVESSYEQAQVPISTCPEQIKTYVYIDDFNTIEKIRITDSESHISTRKRQIRVLALKSEIQFGRVQELAANLNMKVNSKKTQVLCINASSDSIVTSYIRTRDGDINSISTLKILGFHFDSNPSAVFHVTKAIEKFYNKLWTLRFLKRSGMEGRGLLKVYRTIILPSVEYGSEVYDSLIPQYIANKLETVQRQAIKIMFGWSRDVEEIMQSEEIETLQARRTRACLNFANRNVSNGFGERWFPLNPAERQARHTTRRLYEERIPRTERDKNNPVQHMIRLLNRQLSE